MTARNWSMWCCGAVALLLAATMVLAGERPGKTTKTGQYDPKAETVDMFAAMKKGDIAVKLIPKDSKESRVLIENKTDKPLNVKLPEAFAGEPILMQQGPGGGPGGLGRPGGRSGGTGRSGGNQGVGGGMGGMGGGGMFNVPPEKVGELKVPTVCLDHGKAEPRPAVPYEIKPLESYTTKAGVREICEMLGKNQVDQRAAQAAAWHLNNDMSWEQLTAKRLRWSNGMSRPYFSQTEIQSAMQVAGAAVRTAEDRQKADAKTPSSASRGDSSQPAPAAKK